MSNVRRFMLETLSRVGTSVFAGVTVSCLLLGRVELLHFVLFSVGVVLMSCGWPGVGTSK